MSEPPLKLRRSSEDSLSDHDSCTCIFPSNSCSSSSFLHNSNSCSYHLQFQQSLLTLILSHYLRRLSKTSSEFNHCRPRRSLRLGYVSQRFFRSSLPAVKLLFQSDTFVVVPTDLPFLSSIASFFGGEIQSVFLWVDKFFKVEEILESTAIVSRVNYCDSYKSDCHSDSDESDSESDLSDDGDDDDGDGDGDFFCHYDSLNYLLDRSSPLFFPLLRRLDISIGSSEKKFPSLCKSLSTNTTVIEFNVQVISLTTSEADSLTELFYSNKNLKQFSLTCNSYLEGEDCVVLFTSLSNNRSLTKIDLSGCSIEAPTILLPLPNSSRLKGIGFPSGCSFDSARFNSYHNNSSVTELFIPIYRYNPNELTSIFKFLLFFERGEDQHIQCFIINNF
ncbi:hypothetical protein GEMRC1_002571 [Eukaryota sp. GEM-RC1]